MANRLAQETSPYLLQHADNPVDWYPWGDEAFERARAEDKPILLSVGYAASIWLVERIGRKPTLTLFLALGGVSALTFALADTQAVFVASLFFVGFFNLGAWGAVYPYTAELFPTRVRSSAFGMVEGVGKGAAIGGPYLFGALIDWSGDTVWSLIFVALVMVAGATAMLFGRETRGEKLA